MPSNSLLLGSANDAGVCERVDLGVRVAGFGKDLAAVLAEERRLGGVADPLAVGRERRRDELAPAELLEDPGRAQLLLFGNSGEVEIDELVEAGVVGLGAVDAAR